MISLSDVQGYISSAPATSKFKPWWDQLLDFLLTGLFMLMLLSWAKVFSIEAGGFTCVYIDKDSSDIPSAVMRYIQLRCFFENSVTSIQFYPYVLLIQWGVMFIVQVAWVYIPTIESRLRFFDKTIDDILTFDPQFEFSSVQGILPKFDYNDSDKVKLKLIHEKITFMALDKSYISTFYLQKNCLFIIIVLLFIGSVIFLFNRFTFLEVDFPCNLPSGDGKKAFLGLVCNVSTSLYFYGFILLHIIILGLMLVISLRSLFWTLNFMYRVGRGQGLIIEELGPDFKGLPGYIDLVFMLELFQENTRDGNFKISALLFVLASKYSSNQSKKGQFFENDYKISFNQELSIVNFMAEELGFEIQDFTQGPEMFFHNLERIRTEFCSNCVSMFVDIKEEIKEEILNNLEFYSTLLEKSVQFGDITFEGEKSSTGFILKQIENVFLKGYWPNRLFLQAASEVLETTFIIVTARIPYPSDPFNSDIVEPITSDKTCFPILIGFVAPSYYYFLSHSTIYDSEQESRREKYIFKQIYRNKLRQKAAKFIERSISDKKSKRGMFNALYTEKMNFEQISPRGDEEYDSIIENFALNKIDNVKISHINKNFEQHVTVEMNPIL